MLYLDTSAFLKLYAREEGSEWVQSKISSQSDPLPVWDILEMEFHNALRLKVFWKEWDENALARQEELFQQRKTRGLYFVPEISRSELLAEFRLLSAYTPGLGCRTMDILHVACAQLLRPDEFITFDDRQKKLAQISGLNVPDIS
jgi:predicted nucleic acid-binding protein